MSSTSGVWFPQAPVAFALLYADAREEQAALARKRADEEGYQRGFDEATDCLKQQILEQRSDLAQLQEHTFRNLAELHGELVAQVAEALPQLAVEIARRVMAGLEPDRALIQRITDETLAEIRPGSPDVEVRLSPRDFTLMCGLEESLAQKYPGIRVVADSALESGDCGARSRFGEIDGRVSTKLQNVARSLL